MARKLRTFKTTVGFFDLAIAAPSKAAALKAWGTKTDLFRQGFAEEVNDAGIVSATMAKPGTVLRRAVGSNGAFKENAALPKTLAAEPMKKTAAKPVPRKTPPARRVDDEADRKAGLAFKRAEEQRIKKREQEEAAQEKRRQRRAKDIAAAEAALEAARRDHESRATRIQAERAEIERRSKAEDSRWEALKEKLESALRARRR